MKKVAVVILNYNGQKWLEKFLPNVLEHCAYDWCELIVADNCSTDNSLAFVLREFPSIRTIVLDQNTGYAGGYNRALAQIDNEYYVLLNSDVQLSSNWLPPLLSFMEQHPEVGAVQPIIKAYQQPDSFEYAGAAGGFVDFLGYPFCRGRIFDTVEIDQQQYHSNIECHWASGACLFIRKKVFDEAGKLDDDFFAHMEEIDLCWRVRMQGHKIFCISDSIVYHVGGGTLPQGNPRKTFLNFRNNLCMIFKNEAFLRMCWIIPLRLVLDGFAGIQALLLKGNLQDMLAIIKAHWSFYARIPSLLAKRSDIKHQQVSMHNSSIVVQYFLQQKKYFKDL